LREPLPKPHGRGSNHSLAITLSSLSFREMQGSCCPG
jgi:hypothetical protein